MKSTLLVIFALTILVSACSSVSNSPEAGAANTRNITPAPKSTATTTLQTTRTTAPPNTDAPAIIAVPLDADGSLVDCSSENLQAGSNVWAYCTLLPDPNSYEDVVELYLFHQYWQGAFEEGNRNNADYATLGDLRERLSSRPQGQSISAGSAERALTFLNCRPIPAICDGENSSSFDFWREIFDALDANRDMDAADVLSGSEGDAVVVARGVLKKIKNVGNLEITREAVNVLLSSRSISLDEFEEVYPEIDRRVNIEIVVLDVDTSEPISDAEVEFSRQKSQEIKTTVSDEAGRASISVLLPEDYEGTEEASPGCGSSGLYSSQISAEGYIPVIVRSELYDSDDRSLRDRFIRDRTDLVFLEKGTEVKARRSMRTRTGFSECSGESVEDQIAWEGGYLASNQYSIAEVALDSSANIFTTSEIQQKVGEIIEPPPWCNIYAAPTCSLLLEDAAWEELNLLIDLDHESFLNSRISSQRRRIATTDCQILAIHPLCGGSLSEGEFWINLLARPDIISGDFSSESLLLFQELENHYPGTVNLIRLLAKSQLNLVQRYLIYVSYLSTKVTSLVGLEIIGYLIEGVPHIYNSMNLGVQIVDSETGNKIENAKIEVTSQWENSPITTFTNEEGFAKIVIPFAEDYPIASGVLRCYTGLDTRIYEVFGFIRSDLRREIDKNMLPEVYTFVISADGYTTSENRGVIGDFRDKIITTTVQLTRGQNQDSDRNYDTDFRRTFCPGNTDSDVAAWLDGSLSVDEYSSQER